MEPPCENNGRKATVARAEHGRARDSLFSAAPVRSLLHFSRRRRCRPAVCLLVRWRFVVVGAVAAADGAASGKRALTLLVPLPREVGDHYLATLSLHRQNLP